MFFLSDGSVRALVFQAWEEALVAGDAAGRLHFLGIETGTKPASGR